MPRRAEPVDVPTELRAVAASAHGLLTTAQLSAHGVDDSLTRKLIRGDRLRRVHRGVLSIRPELDLAARVAAAGLVLGPVVACLQTACSLLRLEGAPPDPRIHVSLPPKETRHQLEGVARHWLALSPDEVTVVDGLSLTTARRTILDAARRWPRDQVVSVADSALHRGLVRPDELTGLAARLPPRSRPWLGLTDARCESPLETRMRLLLWNAGLSAHFEPQWEVRAGHRVVARIDFAHPALRLGIDPDGSGPHELPEALFRDRWRADDLAALGWRLVRVTWDDVVHRPDVVIGRIRRALSGAA